MAYQLVVHNEELKEELDNITGNLTLIVCYFCIDDYCKRVFISFHNVNMELTTLVENVSFIPIN